MTQAFGNRFNALPQNVDNTVSDEVNADDVFEKAIAEAVQTAIAETTSTVKKGVSSVKPVQTRSTGSNGKMDASTIGEIIRQVVAAIQPMIASVVTAAVSASTKQIVAEVKATTDSQTTEVRNSLGKVKQQVQLQRFDLDRLELYSRRESVRIYGIPESEGEDTNRLVIDLAADMGVTVKPEDISVSHRLPAGRGPRTKAANRPRPIIAKFVRRDMKSQVTRNKRKLREKEGRRWVFIEDDLTPLRAKLVRELKADEHIKNVWTIDGRVFCTRTENGREVKKTIESPEDLLSVGWTEAKVKELGFFMDL